MSPVRPLLRKTVLGLSLLAAAGLGLPRAEAAGEARLLRFPAIHDDFVVFVHAGDVWRVPTSGGEARRLTSHDGVELTPKISPDGEWVAYSAEYGGSRQVWVIPAAGGEPRQLTWYTDVGAMPPRGGFDYWIQGWRNDGAILVRMNRTPWGARPGRYFVVDPQGGLERPLPVPVGGGATFSPDGKRLAYTYYDREFRTWKRYEGGRNQDIWTYDLELDISQRITDAPGSDNFPMWAGDTIYFTSDREHTLNIWSHDLRSGEVRQVTDHDDYDVLWPSLGPGGIVYMNGGHLYRLDLASGRSTRIPITIGDDIPAAVPRWEDASDNVAAVGLSPDGKRAVFEARGDLFTLPAKDGPTRNITRTQGVRESSPAWSPDGGSIAYWSDATGEMELYVRTQDGSGEARQITRGAGNWRFPAAWSPDGKLLAFGDSDADLHIVDVASGEVTTVDSGTQGFLNTYVWSPDSRWLVYESNHPETDLPSLSVYSIGDGKVQVLGDGLTSDRDPAFSHDGKHLFFLSDRDYNLAFSDFEFNYVYDNATRVYAAALDPVAAPLFPLKSDEVEVKQDDGDTADGDSGKNGKNGKKEKKGKKGDDDEAGEKDADDEPEVNIVADGFVARTVALPGVAAGNYGSVTAIEGAVLYRRFPADGPPELVRYDLEKREEKTVAQRVAQYVVGSRGDRVLFRSGSDWTIAPIAADAKGDRLDLSDVRMRLDPRAEWAQMFDECWRIGRDWFYDAGMHGIDWELMRKRYGALVPFVGHRSDLDFIFGEMIGELEAGHAYAQSGEMESVERIGSGMLGAELEADRSGRYRIAKIYPGENWDAAWRSPLTEPGVDVREDQFLLAIDGVELTTKDNPYRLLDGKADRQVELTVADAPGDPHDEAARRVTVRTIASEQNLRYLDWVTSRAAYVDELSGGKIGYIHLPNTAGAGNRALQKYFYSQVAKPGLIVDDRYNGGGFIPDRMIEMLSRTTLSYWARRGVAPNTTPGFRHDGPKAMLINGYAASGGDALPYYFRKVGLGKLIGTTTWGGLIGISGNPMLVDGGGVLYPTFRFYDTEGMWAVEGVGVAPDIEVWDRPEAIAGGGDPSIERAVEVLLEELKGFEGDPREPRPPTHRR